MKQTLSKVFFLSMLSLTLFSSCQKSEVNTQTAPEILPGEELVQFDHGCGCNCPTAVPKATDISYSLSFWQPQVAITTDIFYVNHGPNGTMRLVLRNLNGEIDSVLVVAAPHTNAANPGAINVQFSVDPEGFPYTLHANGRPANLDCSIRERRSFDIVNEASK